MHRPVTLPRPPWLGVALASTRLAAAPRQAATAQQVEAQKRRVEEALREKLGKTRGMAEALQVGQRVAGIQS